MLPGGFHFNNNDATGTFMPKYKGHSKKFNSYFNFKLHTMQTRTVSYKMYAILDLYDMHTGFFSKVIEGISDDDAHNRLNTKANHIAWLTGSLVHERYELANELGIDLKQTNNELFADHKGIRDGIQYPTLAIYKNDWQQISPLLKEGLENITEEQLEKPFEMPGETMNFYDLISFLTYREANCIGQIALWRRILGYEAMKYQ